ncbi:GNAT family N-acetyltransferase [Alkalicoccus halolimnae]|uniref:GNAT family N-acetyltransferase n=1 Tax=Alkalicoccus halolimnae TaxID=1667239 RepID=A0A5C7FGD1_9BACI|nr:GNAT family N-acetyltransferase [Alkalicoccus halolimnae]TXF85334.1 GNAT family N-acetyltransferase [Alkalicoccus halolimnae]
MGTIKRAGVEDAPEILALQKLAYVSEAELYNDFTIMPLREELPAVVQSFEGNVVLKYIEEEQIIGSVRAYEKDGTCHINKLMVHPGWQNRGVGRQLMEEIEKQFENVTYHLFTGGRSKKNIALYEKLGYKGYKEGKLEVEATPFLYMKKEPIDG